MRVAPNGAAIRVRVTATEDGVIVSGARGSRAIGLTGRTGADAARLVALAAVDLELDDGTAAFVDAPPRVVAPPATTKPITIGVVGSVAAWSSMVAGGAIDVAIPRGRWLIAFDLGGGQLLNDDQLELSAAVVRGGGGVRYGWLDVRAGLTLVPINVTTGTGDQTVLVGAGASVRLRVPITELVRFVVAGGADAFATRTEYRTNATMTETPWLAPWFGAGIEMAP